MKKALLLLMVPAVFSCQNLSVEERFNRLEVSEKEELVEELKLMVENDQYYRNQSVNLNKNSSNYKQENDSLWGIIDSIDLANTQRLIEITRKYGFPNVDRIDEPVPAWLIFQHAPEKFHGELKALLASEKTSGRLPALEHAMIQWHLNGRKGSPLPFEVITPEAIDSL